MNTAELTVDELERWLREEDDRSLAQLWTAADQTRRRHVGEQVHLRGLIEISNYCVRQCGYCGLRSDHHNLQRYRMTEEEIMDCVTKAVEYGYGTVVMQSGEDYGILAPWLAGVIHRIKSETPLAVTLGLGERPDHELELWRHAGADRYLLRFETSDSELYNLIHPSLSDRRSDRLAILHTLRELGYEVGSGVMVGIPGQTYRSLANDIDMFRRLDLDMIGVGPYISHPCTPLGQGTLIGPLPSDEQVPHTERMTYKVMALTRLVCPQANIPSTTALAALDQDHGRELGLQRGANVVMPNLTPPRYRALYEIYPDKACPNETAEVCCGCLGSRIAALGRAVGTGPGGRAKHNFADIDNRLLGNSLPR